MRTFDLLEAVVIDSGQRPLQTIAKQLNIPPSTAHRMAASLIRRGLITSTRRGYYGAGMHLADLAAYAQPNDILIAASRPLLRQLAQDMGATAHLGIWDGDMVTYLVKEEGRAIPIFTREGGQLEGYCSAIGKLLLAHLNDDVRELYLAGGPFVALTEHTLTKPEHIRLDVLKAARDDCAFDNQEIAEGLFCIAVPIRRAGGAVIAAISLSRSGVESASDGPPSLLLNCGQAISAKLGFSPS